MANTLNLGNGNWATKEDSLLGYNSENNNFKPLPFDFTRASSATVVNKQGLIETVGSGEPRIDFLGNTQGALKLEPQRTNLITQSESFPNPYWTKSGASIQGDPSTAGSELVTNGDFATDSDWNKGTGWTISGGSLNASATTAQSFQTNTGLVSGKTYKVTYTISNYVSGSVRIELGSANVSVGLIRSANGTYTECIEALGDETIYFDAILSFTGSIDNVSVKEVQGFTSPDGGLNAFKFVEGTNNGEHIIYKISIGFTSGATLSYSFFAKKGERNVIQTYNYVGGGFQNGADFDLSTGVVSNQYGGLGSMTELDNGWWRCDFTSLALVGQTNTNVAIRTLDNSSSNSYQGDGTSGLYIYGAQLEQGSYATSYIPTQGSTVTRLADACNNGGNEQVINSTEGVLYAEISTNSDGTDKAISLNNNTVGSLSNRLWLGYSTSAKKVFALGYVNNSIQFALSKLMTDETAFVKIACKYALNDVAFFVNGEKVDTDTSALAFTELNSFDFNIGNGSGAAPFYGNVKDVRVYNTALTDSELAILTTI